ncbi:MAG TPA: FAD-linked oxidase C-terminal domain-containing protein [Casimicrobiaceae bacterium]|nr:FAD-linked oxidase C-terminal domain-containing protein [Casimicrobiaceae bacterium]
MHFDELRALGETARELPESLIVSLRERFGERLSTSRAVREHHGTDVSSYPVVPPDGVVFAESTDDVVDAVTACVRDRVPVIAFGTGTSVEGHVLALRGGVCIDVSRMNRVLEVNAADLDARVQAGVTRKALNAHVRDAGLFFPIDPGADASLGGMASTRASGTNAVRYGTMRENVLGLTVVLPDGRLIRTGGRARKSAAGYDLTRLFVGAEGTLGIITELTLRLYPVPDGMSAAVCAFPTVRDAVDAVIEATQVGIPLARVELLDTLTIGAINRYSKLALRESPTLWFEFHGTRSGVEEQARDMQSIATDHGGLDFEWSTRPEERTRLWQARHDAYFACLALRPGSRMIATDVCVPISRLADCIAETQADIAQMAMPIPLFGHVGDGNFHLMILVKPDDDREIEEAWDLNARLVRRALAMGGTCTGEHGIGLGKREFLVEEFGDAVDVMRGIKASLDPLGLFNPGKIF